MSDCGRRWGMSEDDNCHGCWGVILEHLITRPTEPVLPQRQFCQDAAYIAHTLDARLASREALEAAGRKITQEDG